MTHTPLCHCGRPLHHTGPHTGEPHGKRDLEALLLKRARETIRRQHTAIARLKAEIRSRQDALLTVEARLSPLVAFVSAWEDVAALPAPETPDPAPPANRPPITASPAETATPEPPAIDPHKPTVATRCSRCRRFRPRHEFIPGSMQCMACRGNVVTIGPRTDPPADPGPPVNADFDQVAKWAVQRGIAFMGWDDLPRVNRKREDLGLATFKRRMGRALPSRLAAGAPP